MIAQTDLWPTIFDSFHKDNDARRVSTSLV